MRLCLALAMAAVTSDFYPEIFDFHPKSSPGEGPLSLLAILNAVYDSEVMKPVMPYDPSALLGQRFKDAFGPGSKRPAEIRHLTSAWAVSDAPSMQEANARIKELFFTATLLFAGTGRASHTPRLDFFLMHILNATLFLPSILPVITPESRGLLFRAFVPVILAYLTIRGRPRINAPLIMSYTSTPRPPSPTGSNPSQDAIGDSRAPEYVNPWPAIISDILHAPDSHTIKATRALYYASKHYGNTPVGGVPGALRQDGSEVLSGIAQVDGTVFARAAGVLIDTLGWVTHGQRAGSWDRSGLGWDEAWSQR
jgi:hypothetical protein